MPSLTTSTTSLPVPAEALAYTVADLQRVARIGKTRAYELIAAGQLRAMKCGSRTLICAESVRSYLASLPNVPAKAA
ncbi:MAG: helix-turn-helix domain-containing protein [Acetobacteraceae bacterium]|nr:helix-turn-helix domain-containing protein [Acetobacteraceae bacterium]